MSKQTFNFFLKLSELLHKSTNLSLLFVTVFVSFHLLFLSQIPYFEDEALFTGWSRDIQLGISSFSIPLANGIGPLFTWITLIPSYFLRDHFIAGRLVSICAGLVSSLVVIRLSGFISAKKISFLAGIVYASLPITFVYHRLAVLESLLTMFVLLTIYFCAKFLAKPARKSFMLFGFSLFFAILTKQIAFVFMPGLLIGTYVYKKNWKDIIAVLVCSLLIFAAIGLLYFPFRQQSMSFLSDYVFLPTSIGNLIFQLKKNLWLTLHWVIAYFPFSILVSAALGTVIALIKSKSIYLFYLSLLMASAIGIIITDKLFFPRHLMVITPFILLMSTLFLSSIYRKNHAVGIALILILIAQNTIDCAQLLVYPGDNDIMAKEDIFQLYEDWTSGIGFSKVTLHLDQVSNAQTKTVWVDSSIYYYGLPLVASVNNIQTRWITEKLVNDANCKLDNEFIVLNKSISVPLNLEGCRKKVVSISPRHEVQIYQ